MMNLCERWKSNLDGSYSHTNPAGKGKMTQLGRNRETRGLTPDFSDVIVVGAGAAGMMCAIEAGKRGRSVTVIERNDAFGKKIRISGGGRCNFTNIHTAPENFICANKHFH